jgi:predicted AAA+ superfamily ATPase
MRSRYLSPAVSDLCFSDHKIAFISGPRRCGKTTLAKMILDERKTGRYCNWDDIAFRRIWAKEPKSIIPESTGAAGGVPLVVLDEIHKARSWKRTLKGVYDTLKTPADILVTGSARLAVYRKGSDSLLGRYLPFRLHPFSLREMDQPDSLPPGEVLECIFTRSLRSKRSQQDRIESLMEFGPFPEPLFSQNKKKARLWRRTRVEAIIRQDLRDMTRIPEFSRIEMMAALVPDRVGSPFSISSLQEDLEVSHPTVKRWLLLLQELYYLYEIKPFQKRIARSLKKEGKVYLWDWSEVPDRAARFENLVAGHLLKACHFWTDTGEGDFELYYLRNKEKQEIDFLITKDGHPWLPVEAKLSESTPSPNWRKFLKMLPCRRALQLISTPGHWKEHSIEDAAVLTASAGEILDYLI